MKYAVSNGSLIKVSQYAPVLFDDLEYLRKTVRSSHLWKKDKEYFKKYYKIVEVDFKETDLTFEEPKVAKVEKVYKPVIKGDLHIYEMQGMTRKDFGKILREYAREDVERSYKLQIGNFVVSRNGIRSGKYHLLNVVLAQVIDDYSCKLKENVPIFNGCGLSPSQLEKFSGLARQQAPTSYDIKECMKKHYY